MSESSRSTDGCPFEAIEAAISGGDSALVTELLEALVESIRDCGRPELVQLGDLLCRLVEIASCGDDELGRDVLENVREGVRLVSEDVASTLEPELLDAYTQQAHARWESYLSLIDGEETPDFAETAAVNPGLDTESDDDHPAESDGVGLILNALQSGGITQPIDVVDVDDASEGSFAVDTSSQPTTTPWDPQPASYLEPASAPASLADDVEMDPELKAAFLDDAGTCLSSMEQAVLKLEESIDDVAGWQQLCRDLHTLKGASASVGLNGLSEFLHQLEDQVQQRLDGEGSGPSIDELLQHLDAIRIQVDLLSGSSATPAPTPQEETPNRLVETPTWTPSADSQSNEDEPTLRVKASQLDRLMDLLSELVMLRNRRETGLSQLRDLHDELHRCITRVRLFADRARDTHVPAEESSDSSTAYLSHAFKEVGRDIGELARGLRDVYEPLGVTGQALSELIGDFRQELIQLRRLPVSGLFRRLQRAARDAARAEGKQVRLELIGEQTGLERSLQERLYEPLLHMVRNAVSHGIESPEARESAGKPATGTIWLEAHAGPSSLSLKIRDDGSGLDYDAIRRRGLQAGLIDRDQPVSDEDLAQLIFHPGFSTRETASQISGRGVGMDVVAVAMSKLRSQLDVESESGQGTTLRIHVPLTSIIDHTMVFRVAGQLYAVPMSSVIASGTLGPAATSADAGTELFADDSQTRGLPRTTLHEVLGLGDPPVTASSYLVIKANPLTQVALGDGEPTSPVVLLVDAVVGPEEVVVRSVPAMLRRHPLLSGITLSGGGETVMLFDGPTLVRRARSHLRMANGASVTDEGETDDAPATTVLVVDDSLSARKTLCRLLARRGLEFIEASDGVEGLERLREVPVAAVFSDLDMPRLGGLDLLADCRREDAGLTVPIVIVSARGDEQTRKRVMELGADAFLSKPVNDRQLGEVLERLPLQIGQSTVTGNPA